MPSPGAENKNLSLSLFVWFSVELISALLIRYSDTVLVSVAFCERKGRRGEEGVEKKNKQTNKQLLPSPTISGEIKEECWTMMFGHS